MKFTVIHSSILMWTLCQQSCILVVRTYSLQNIKSTLVMYVGMFIIKATYKAKISEVQIKETNCYLRRKLENELKRSYSCFEILRSFSWLITG